MVKKKKKKEMMILHFPLRIRVILQRKIRCDKEPLKDAFQFCVHLLRFRQV